MTPSSFFIILFYFTSYYSFSHIITLLSAAYSTISRSHYTSLFISKYAYLVLTRYSPVFHTPLFDVFSLSIPLAVSLYICTCGWLFIKHSLFFLTFLTISFHSFSNSKHATQFLYPFIALLSTVMSDKIRLYGKNERDLKNKKCSHVHPAKPSLCDRHASERVKIE